MKREEWYQLHREVRTPQIGENLFPKNERADIAIQIVKTERKEARKRAAQKNDD